jgi:preprotein translocase subunit SecF
MQPILALHRYARNPSSARIAMRTLLLLIALLLIIGIVLVATGVVNLSRDSNGAISVTTENVTIGTTPANVTVPVVGTETRQVDVPSVTVGNQANQQ